ncbi:MAG: DUF4351 domain-containing protein [Gloeocapsa sp. DLM2.Bin57]|nr:MAG: DUF4351 domain-containing protein [Gloeocapsa sp. DLM2.Bin57]
MKKADIGSKRLISLAPNNWIRWITQRQDLTFCEFLSGEFQWLSRENDVLMKIVGKKEGEFLMLNELQLRYQDNGPLRMRVYAALAQERYNLPVYPVLINILPHVKNPNIPNFYEEEFMGIRSYQSYRVVNLWEVPVELVFRDNISSLLPFVPILKGGGEEVVVREAVRKLREEEELTDLEPLLSFFASFVLEMPLVQEIMRWDMVILRESPWYQEILKEGLQLGEERGREEGEANLLIRLLSKRFGEIDPSLESRIRQLGVSQREGLGESIFDFSSWGDVSDWLDNQVQG